MSFTKSIGYSIPAAFRVTQPGVKGSMYPSGNPPPPSTPPAVTGFMLINSTTTTIDLEWNASSGATLYTIVSDSEIIEPVTTGGTSWTYTDLSPGTAYTFTITPSNASGNGPPTALYIPAFPDLAPAIFNAQLSATTTTIEFEWIEDYTPPDADSYKVYCQLDGIYEVLYVQTCPLTPNYYTFTGLQTNNGYVFRLSSVNERGEQIYAGGYTVAMLTIPTVTGVSVSNPTTTTIDITWDTPTTTLNYLDFEYAITSTPVTTTQTINGASAYTFYGLTPGTEYTFTVTLSVNPPGDNQATSDPVTSDPIYTLIEPAYLTYTGTIETLFITPGSYNFEIAGGSGPLNKGFGPNAYGARSYGTLGYTVTSPITIQYAIGQAAPGNTGGAGGTFVYDMTNSQMLFVAGGAGSNFVSPDPTENDPLDGSGGAAGAGGGSGAGVNSNGSNSTANGGSGGLTFGNGAAGGTGGTIGTAYAGGFGGGGGGSIISDPVLGQVYYVGGGGGYTGGSASTNYEPELYSSWYAIPGRSYAISGTTLVTWTAWTGGGNVSQDGYLNIIPV